MANSHQAARRAVRSGVSARGPSGWAVRCRFQEGQAGRNPSFGSVQPRQAAHRVPTSRASHVFCKRIEQRARVVGEEPATEPMMQVAATRKVFPTLKSAYFRM